MKEKEMIRPVCEFLGEIRYSIVDKNIRRVVNDDWRLFDIIEDMMTKVWLYIRRPTSYERKWAATFHGDTRSEDLFRICYRYRKSFLAEVRRNKQVSIEKCILQTLVQRLLIECKNLT